MSRVYFHMVECTYTCTLNCFAVIPTNRFDVVIYSSNQCHQFPPRHFETVLISKVMERSLMSPPSGHLKNAKNIIIVCVWIFSLNWYNLQLQYNMQTYDHTHPSPPPHTHWIYWIYAVQNIRQFYIFGNVITWKHMNKW